LLPPEVKIHQVSAPSQQPTLVLDRVTKSFDEFVAVD